ncbi:MAG: DUF2971 domain-containing protein [Ignavibacteriales bacterium]
MDAFEGYGYEFFKKATKDHQLANKDDFYGSCWSLQSEEKSLYEDVKEYELAIEELESEGSASMWESYCRNGGVRIKTTVGKINNLLSDYLEGFNIYRGRVFYEPASSWKKTKESYRNRDVVLTFFLKRISFRYESEYRYIIVPNKHIKENIVSVLINNILYDFIDEILVSPATTSNKWISRTLYNIGIRIPPPSSGLNSAKNGKQFCRISQLYGPISQVLGHQGMGSNRALYRTR